MTAPKELVERVATALRDVAVARALREHGPGQQIPWQAFEEDARAAIDQLSSDLSSLERMREALKPFAIEVGGQWDDNDAMPHYLCPRFKVGDFRRARQALSPVAPESEG